MAHATWCLLVMAVAAAVVAVEAHPYYRKPYYYRPSYYSQRGKHSHAGDPHDATISKTPLSTGSVDLPAAEGKPVSPVSSGDPDLDLAALLGETDGLSDSPSLPASPSNPTNFDVDIRAQR